MIISNATSKGSCSDIYKFAMEYKLLQPLVNLLDSNDSKIVEINLQSIKNILNIGDQSFEIHQDNIFLCELEKLGGTKKLENLQLHKNKEVYTKALSILENYYEIEDPI